MTSLKILALLLCMACVPAVADDRLPRSVVTETIVNLPIARAWDLFSTADGLATMGYNQAVIELRNGGRLDAQPAMNNLVPRSPMSATITTYEPQRLLALQWRDGSGDWSVLHFQQLGQEMTGLRWVELTQGDPSPVQVRAQAHRELFDVLVRRYTIECHVCREEREAREATEAAPR